MTAALALLLSGFVANVLGYPASYGPFAPGHEPAAVQFAPCELVRNVSSPGDDIAGAIREYRLPAAAPDRRQITLALRGTTNGWEIHLRAARGGQLLPAPFTNRMTASQMKVDYCDLNGDGRPDFIVNVWSGGSGLAADGSEVTFLISAEDDYRAASFYLYAFGNEDLVRFKPKEPVYFIFSDLINSDGEQTRDGREHNFWVYELKRIDGNRFVPANADQPGFPKWVWFTDKANHAQTTQLTQKQKQRLLGKRTRSK